jgi:hypothetical protein
MAFSLSSPIPIATPTPIALRRCLEALYRLFMNRYYVNEAIGVQGSPN